MTQWYRYVSKYTDYVHHNVKDELPCDGQVHGILVKMACFTKPYKLALTRVGGMGAAPRSRARSLAIQIHD